MLYVSTHSVIFFLIFQRLMATIAFYLNHILVCSLYFKYAAPLPLDCSVHACDWSYDANPVSFMKALTCKLGKPGLIYRVYNQLCDRLPRLLLLGLMKPQRAQTDPEHIELMGFCSYPSVVTVITGSLFGLTLCLSLAPLC